MIEVSESPASAGLCPRLHRTKVNSKVRQPESKMEDGTGRR